MDSVSQTARAPMPRWAERLVLFLDDGWTLPGTGYRVGADALIGMLLPGVGDVITGSGSLALVWLALQRGAPTVVLLRMVLNLVFDSVFGSLPIVGDAFDLFFKSNRRNLQLLERASHSARPARAVDYAIVGAAVLLVFALACLPLLLLYTLVGASGG